MSQFIAHEKTKADLDAIVASPKGAYMLVGPRWSGKRAAADYVADKLGSGTYDQLRILPNEKGTISIEIAHSLVDQLSRKPNSDAIRIVIVESAEAMTTAAQNALLKIIEEPPRNTIFLLLVSNVAGLLPTIKSRCQVIYVRPIPGKNIHNDIISRAEEIMSASLFDRIILIDKLAIDKDKDQIIDALAYLVSRQARKQNATSQSLQSMQNYFIDSNAGVAAKHALTEMMIRL